MAKRQFDASVSWLRSVKTGREFPMLVFSADVDFVTTEFVSLSSTDVPEVVAARLAPYEELSEEGFVACSDRLNAELNRSDLRWVQLLRSEETFTAPEGISFQEFRKIYRPAKLFYSDIYDEDGEAECVRTESIEEFETNGGRLIDRLSSA